MNKTHNAKHNVMFKRSAAALIVAGVMSMSTAVVADEPNYSDIEDRVDGMLDNVDTVGISLGISATPAVDAVELTDRLVDLEVDFDVLATPTTTTDSDVEDGISSFTELYNKTKALYDIVLGRCEYMRDNGGMPPGRPNLATVAQRMQQLEIGAQLLVVEPTDPLGRPTMDTVAFMADEIERINAIMADEGDWLGSLGNTGVLSFRDIYYAVDDIHQRALTACPI